MEFSITELKLGMKVKCLNCNETIELTRDTFLIDFEAEYIYCPECGKYCDTHYYFRYGEVVE
jgi:DNA-directed RNA polymerase subunit RPC12/RpoP